MGLDMYLDKEIYIGAEYEHNHIHGTIDLFSGDKKIDVDLSKVSTITERSAYWRKANAIHNWFVDNVQEGKDDCGRHYVSRDDMQNLLDTINKVLESIVLEDGELVNGYSFQNGKETPMIEKGKVIKDSSVAEQLLPSASGSFFGNTDYNEWYVDDLKYTKEVLESILAKEEDKGSYYYQSSWQ